MNLLTEAFSLFKERGQKTAIVDQNGTEISYGDLYTKVLESSSYFQKYGINSRSQVLILLPLSIELYSTLLALFKLGATVILIDPWSKKEYIKNALATVKPDYLILTKKAKLFFVHQSIRRIKNRIYDSEFLNIKNIEINESIAEVDGSHPALITFTSGTTGHPKAFLRSHEFLREQQKAHESSFKKEELSIELTMYPVFVLSNLKIGITTILLKGDLKNIDSIDMSLVNDQIKKYNVNTITLSPYLLNKLLETKENLEGITFYTGGGPIGQSLIKKLKDLKGYLVYGSTEAEPIALLPFDEATDKEEYFPLGEIIPNHRFKLDRIKNHLHPYHKNLNPSELHLTGTSVSKGYINIPLEHDETKYKDLNGNIWHKTGDIVHQSPDGMLSMLGRKNDLISTKEGFLFPLIIEEELKNQFNVEECCYTKHNDKYILLVQGNADISEIKKAITNKNIPIDDIIPQKMIPMDNRHHSKIERKKVLKEISTMSDTNPIKIALAYTKERFPIIPIALFTTLFYFSSYYFLQNINNKSITISFIHITQIFSLFLFMLQLRLSDEIKDYEKDKIAHPERLLSRGIINLKTIETVLFFVIGLQILFNFYIGSSYFIMMLIIQIYAYLMKVEFFAKNFLEKKIGLYLISHQLILPLLCLYNGVPSFDSINSLLNIELYLVLIYLTLPSTLYELMRKTWNKEREHELADSYTKVYGINKALLIELVIIGAISLLSISLIQSLAYSASIFLLAILIIISLFLFKIDPSHKKSKLLEHVSSIYLLLFHILNIVFFISKG